MSSHSEVAHEFRLSLEAGVIDRSEIIRWADGILANEKYDDDIANISLAAHENTSSLISLLSAVASEKDYWTGVRRMLGRMHEALLQDPARLREFASFLGLIGSRSYYDVPKDLNFILSAEDDIYLAEVGYYGPSEERDDLVTNLARYRFSEANSNPPPRP